MRLLTAPAMLNERFIHTPDMKRARGNAASFGSSGWPTLELWDIVGTYSARDDVQLQKGTLRMRALGPDARLQHRFVNNDVIRYANSESRQTRPIASRRTRLHVRGNRPNIWRQCLRKELFQYFLDCLRVEIRPVFDDPIYINGSFVTDKEIPYDIDVVLDLRNTTDGRMLQGLVFMTRHQTRFLDEYRVHFWINLPGFEDFSTFFQYVGTKTARFKSLNPRHLKGILRIVR